MLLRKDDPWPRELPIPDIRNWRVQDQDGKEVGFVETLVIDRPNGHFEALLVGANDRFAADDIDVEDGLIRIKRSLHRVPIRTDESADQPPGFDASYRGHFEQTYDGERVSFEDVELAYRFGREAASDADFAGLSFGAAQENLMARYRSENRSLPFNIARDAVAWAFELARRSRPVATGGMGREDLQILGRSENAHRRTETAGGAMSTTQPGDE